MTSFSALRRQILNWAASVIPTYTVLLANTGEGARPDGNYIIVFLREGTSPGVQVNNLSEDGDTETIMAYTPFTCTLDIYGGNAMQVGNRLERSLKSAMRELDLWTVCGLSNINPKMDLTNTIAGSRKQRCLVTLKMNAILSDTFDASAVESMPIEIQASDDTINVEFDSNVPPPTTNHI